MNTYCLNAKARRLICNDVERAMKCTFKTAIDSQRKQNLSIYNLQQFLWRRFKFNINHKVHTQVRNVLFNHLKDI